MNGNLFSFLTAHANEFNCFIRLQVYHPKQMSKLEQARHPFEKALTVCSEDLQGVLNNFPALQWLDFWLNSRRLRGSDFLMRWSQGVWSEHRLTEAVNETGKFFAIPYGPSGTAPTGSVREFELYFERLEAAGLGKIKRPDLLLFPGAGKMNTGS